MIAQSPSLLARQPLALVESLVHSSSSIWCAACGPFFPQPVSGARVSPWRWRRLPRAGRIPGRLVGGVYAANTVGAILGALLFSMVLIPRIGTQRSQRVLIALAACLFPDRCWPRGCGGCARLLAYRRGGCAGRRGGSRAACLPGAWPDFPGEWLPTAGSLLTSARQFPDSLRGRGHECLDRHLRSGRTASGPVPRQRQRWRPPASRTTCGCNACWATFRRCCTRSRGRC